MTPRTTPTVLLVAMISLAGCEPATQHAQAPSAPSAPSATTADTTTVRPVAPAPAAPAARPPSPEAASVGTLHTDATPAAASPAPRAARDALPLVVVHKSPSCGCCHLWVEHMQKAGFTVEVRDTDDLNVIKERVGIPLGKGSCHTAEVDGYFVEGHVPAGDVKRMLAVRPEAKGLVLPGMPAGSPGMEVPDGRIEPYTVELVGRDGATTPFASHPD